MIRDNLYKLLRQTHCEIARVTGAISAVCLLVSVLRLFSKTLCQALEAGAGTNCHE